MTIKKEKIKNKLGSIKINTPKTDFNKLFHQRKEGTAGLDNALLVDIVLITPNPNQPRKHFKKESLQELADSIKERGVLQPIRVRPKGDKYEIIAGERRWQASQLADLKNIPCIVIEQDDKATYIDALMENIQRENLNSIDRANALDELKVNLGSPSWEEVGKRLGITKRHIFNLIGLKSLPDYVQDDIRNNILTEKHGRALKKLNKDQGKLENAYNKIKSYNMSGDDALSYIQSMKRSYNPETNKHFNAVKKANQQYQDMLIISDFQKFDTAQKQLLLKSLTEMKNIIDQTINNLNE